MGARRRQIVIVSGLPDVPAFQLHCEPEGSMHEVLTGDVVTLTFEADAPQPIEISPVSDGLLLSHWGDSEVSIDDKRGRQLSWGRRQAACQGR